MSKIIMGIKVEKRHAEANHVQTLLTDYGCFIKTRLGLHKATDNREVCSEDGLILLEFINDCDKEAEELEGKLETLEGIHVRKMIF